MALKIIFAGTPEFAAVALRQLLASDHRVVAVYTQPDRPAGRGRHLTASAVKTVALAAQIPVYQPLKLKQAPAEWAQLQALEADLMVVAAYGLILPPEVLAIPRYGCLNIHASLLPRWRGAAPIQRAILAGDTETGVTMMQMDAGLDTGAMLLRGSLPIQAGESAAELHDRLAQLGGELLLETLTQLEQGQLQPEPQHEPDATYAAKLSKAEADLDWSQPATQLARQVAALNNWPVAQSRWQGEVVRIWRAEPLELNHHAAVGQILTADRHGITVACGSGGLRITELQLPGRKPVAAADFIRSATFTEESRFG